MRISLLQFFKTFQKYLANAFLGQNMSLLRFFIIAKYRKIAVMKYFDPKNALAKYLANATFSQNQKSH